MLGLWGPASFNHRPSALIEIIGFVMVYRQISRADSDMRFDAMQTLKHLRCSDCGTSCRLKSYRSNGLRAELPQRSGPRTRVAVALHRRRNMRRSSATVQGAVSGHTGLGRWISSELGERCTALSPPRAALPPGSDDPSSGMPQSNSDRSSWASPWKKRSWCRFRSGRHCQLVQKFQLRNCS